MKPLIKIGDLFNTKSQVIAHQVNCIGVMGSGIAKLIKDKYPEVFNEYTKAIDFLGSKGCLGGCLLYKASDNKYIANIFGQFTYNGGPLGSDSLEVPSPTPNPDDKYFEYDKGKLRYTNYEAFYRALIKLRADMNRMDLSSVSFPYKIGSDRGGGDWPVILSMIDSVFSESKIKVEICKLNKDKDDIVCRDCGALMKSYHHKLYKCTNPECSHKLWYS